MTLGVFLLSVVALSAVLGALALPWVDLPWWKVIRRSVSIAAALSVWIVARVERRTVRSYGLTEWSAGREDLLVGLGGGALTLVGFFGMAIVAGWCEVAITSDYARLWRTVLGFLPAALLVAVLEELVFRGVILQHLLPSSRTLAVVGSSALYALVHLKTLRLDPLTFTELGGLFLLGLILAYSVLHTRRLFLAIGLHAVLAYGVRVNKLLIHFPDPTVTWLTGTHRLVNGVMGWVVLLLIWTGVAWWSARRRHAGQGREAGPAH